MTRTRRAIGTILLTATILGGCGACTQQYGRWTDDMRNRPAQEERVKDPRVTLIPPKVIQEDDPGWDCHTMGNRICGPLAD